MRAQLIKRLNDVKASYWFVPLCMVLGAVCLTQVLTSSFVQSFDRWLYTHSWMSATEVDGARELLSIVSASILGVAGVTFSITIVAVSFASSNFGPRLINNFMSDRGSQYTLGTFLGTFVYCLVILNHVHESSSDAAQQTVYHQLPQIATLMALPLALASIGVLIYFIHHIAETINIENIVASIGYRLIQRTQENFPGERHLESRSKEEDARGSADFQAARDCQEMTTVNAMNNGYVQAVNISKLQKLAGENSYHVDLHYVAGDFVSSHDPLMNVWADNAEEGVKEEELRGCFAVGSERTEHQNTLFLVEQLTEVIARALSPGVNDPYTAIACLNQFKSALSAYLNNDSGNQDQKGNDSGRIRMTTLNFERMVQAMFDPCRQYICADTNVSLHAMNVLAACAWQAGLGPEQSVLVAQMHALERSTSQQPEGGVDAMKVSERLQVALTHIDDSTDQPLTGTPNYWNQL